MATYEVTCEFVAERTVWVDARHGVEAKELAKAEISKRESIPTEEVGVVDAKRETMTHPYHFDFWRFFRLKNLLKFRLRNFFCLC